MNIFHGVGSKLSCLYLFIIMMSPMMIMCNCNLIPPFFGIFDRFEESHLHEIPDVTLFDSCSTRSAVEFDFGFSGGWWSTPTESGASTYLGAASSDVMNLILWLQHLWPKPKVWQKNSLTPTIILTHRRLIAKKPSVGLSRSPRPGFGKQGSNLRGMCGLILMTNFLTKRKVRIIAGHGELGATRAGGRFVTVAVSN